MATLKGIGRFSCLDLDIIEFELAYYPSLNIRVEVRDEGFVAAARDVWVEWEEWQHFLSDLQGCERVRTGHAALTSMSPDECEITIERGDGLGHFLLTYQLARDRYTCRGSMRQAFSGAFDLDMEHFQENVTEILELARSCPGPLRVNDVRP